MTDNEIIDRMNAAVIEAARPELHAFLDRHSEDRRPPSPPSPAFNRRQVIAILAAIRAYEECKAEHDAAHAD